MQTNRFTPSDDDVGTEVVTIHHRAVDRSVPTLRTASLEA